MKHALPLLISCIVPAYSSAIVRTVPETNDAILLRLLEQTAHSSQHRQQWRPIQETTRDTVVQVFSQKAELDIIQPYKTPAQYGSRGSGFFISDDGYIITNAHVIDQSIAIWIQIPSLGRRLIDVHVVGVCPQRDVALLRVSDEGIALIRAELGMISYLPLGDSDKVHRADEVLALGYPLGQESLKSTTGVISGREKNLIQMSAAINPGSSGGPLLNVHGEVIGINSAGITEAQNIGYIIPINDLKVVLPDLYTVKLLRNPYLGIVTENATDLLTTFLGNPQPGGCYVLEVVKDSPVYKAGMQPGDMIYQVNGYTVDIYGEMRVPWSEDKISIANYISRLALDEVVELILYRQGVRIPMHVQLSVGELAPIRKIYPGYEMVDYEVFAGMVVMELSLNHIKMMATEAPRLDRFTELKNQTDSVLVITHIFPNSQLFKTRTLMPSSTLQEINGIPVHSLADFRRALFASLGTPYFTIKAADNVRKTSDNIFVVLPFAKIVHEEPQLSALFKYPLSATVQQLIEAAQG